MLEIKSKLIETVEPGEQVATSVTEMARYETTTLRVTKLHSGWQEVLKVCEYPRADKIDNDIALLLQNDDVMTAPIGTHVLVQPKASF